MFPYNNRMMFAFLCWDKEIASANRHISTFTVREQYHVLSAAFQI